MIQTLWNEVGTIWTWTMGVVAGLGITTILFVIGFVMVYIRLRDIESIIKRNQNSFVAESRDLSLRIREMEKQK